MESDRAHISVQIFFLKTNSPSRKNMMFSKFQFIAFFSHIMLCNLVWNWFLPSLVVYLAASPGADTPLWLLPVKGFFSCIKKPPLLTEKATAATLPMLSYFQRQTQKWGREHLPPPCSLSKKIFILFYLPLLIPKRKTSKRFQKILPCGFGFSILVLLICIS